MGKKIQLLKAELYERICYINDKDIIKQILDFVKSAVLTDLKIDDVIEIIDTGSIYEIYSDMFKHYGFKNVTCNKVPSNYKEMTWKVIGRPTQHPDQDNLLVAIKSNVGFEVLINIDGLKKVNK